MTNMSRRKFIGGATALSATALIGKSVSANESTVEEVSNLKYQDALNNPHVVRITSFFDEYFNSYEVIRVPLGSGSAYEYHLAIYDEYPTPELQCGKTFYITSRAYYSNVRTSDQLAYYDAVYRSQTRGPIYEFFAEQYDRRELTHYTKDHIDRMFKEAPSYWRYMTEDGEMV